MISQMAGVLIKTELEKSSYSGVLGPDHDS